MACITIMQQFMLLPHSELLCLKSARVAWTIVNTLTKGRTEHNRTEQNRTVIKWTILWKHG